MRNRISHCCAVLVLLSFLVHDDAHGGHVPLDRKLTTAGYAKVAYENGVKVFKHKTSRTVRVGAEGVIDASAEEILAAVLDYQGQLGKLKMLAESRVLQRHHDHLIVYQRLDLPVISDRDFTLRVKWWKRNGVTYVNYRAMRNMGPKSRRGIVRVTNHSGTWQIKPLANCSRSLVRFEAEIDLAGSLPKWMARSGTGNDLLDLYRSVETMVESRRRAQKRVASVRK